MPSVMNHPPGRSPYQQGHSPEPTLRTGDRHATKNTSHLETVPPSQRDTPTLAVSTFQVAADLGAVTATHAFKHQDYQPGHLDVRVRILQLSDLMGIASTLAGSPEQTVVFAVARWTYESIYYCIVANDSLEEMIPDMHRTLAGHLIKRFGPTVDTRHLTGRLCGDRKLE